jgi:hypothetical protein
VNIVNVVNMSKWAITGHAKGPTQCPEGRAVLPLIPSTDRGHTRLTQESLVLLELVFRIREAAALLPQPMASM